MPAQPNIIQVTWQQAESHLREVRTKVFIEEQCVPPDLEWDELDESARHLLVMNDANEPIACARLLNNGSIGRMAVLRDWRGLGVGSTLLRMAIELQQKQGAKIITLSAQMHAIAFYEKAGFVVSSQPYLDANIPHVDMLLTLGHL